MSLSRFRQDYGGEPLDERQSSSDPFEQFSLWFEQVRSLEQDPTAMFLATAAWVRRKKALCGSFDSATAEDSSMK